MKLSLMMIGQEQSEKIRKDKKDFQYQFKLLDIYGKMKSYLES